MKAASRCDKSDKLGSSLAGGLHSGRTALQKTNGSQTLGQDQVMGKGGTPIHRTMRPLVDRQRTFSSAQPPNSKIIDL